MYCYCDPTQLKDHARACVVLNPKHLDNALIRGESEVNFNVPQAWSVWSRCRLIKVKKAIATLPQYNDSITIKCSLAYTVDDNQKYLQASIEDYFDNLKKNCNPKLKFDKVIPAECGDKFF
jgi:hypothetical protein